MSGGIIIQRRAALVPAAMDSSIYSYLSDDMKDAVEAVAAKDPASCTEEDIKTLARAIHEACC